MTPDDFLNALPESVRGFFTEERLRHWYRLDDQGEPVECRTMAEWAMGEERMGRTPGRKIVRQEHVGAYWVSTIFLPINHSYGDGPPVLWETMVFLGEDSDLAMDRCSGSREQAEAMHQEMKRTVQAQLDPALDWLLWAWSFPKDWARSWRLREWRKAQEKRGLVT